MLCYIPGVTQSKVEVLSGEGDHVILLDGIAHGGYDMGRLARTLNREGYQVLNLGYPSTSLPISEIAGAYLPEQLATYLPEDGRTVHFMTHSMGGIVLRQFMNGVGMPRMGRAVMFAPPNHGSEVAERLRDFFFYQWYFGPAGQEIGIGPESVPLSLPAADFEVGIIAGEISIDPWFDPLFDERHDGKVSVASTRLEGMKDFRVVQSSHYGMHFNREVHTMAMRFLSNGRF